MAILSYIKERKTEQEFQQGLIRVASMYIFVVPMAFAFTSGYFNVPKSIYSWLLAYPVIYSSGLFLHILRFPKARYRIDISLLSDHAMLGAYVFYTGGISSPFIIFYLWVTSTQALRFGKMQMLKSYLLSIVSFSTILALDNDLTLHYYSSVALLLALIIIPVSTYLIRDLYDQTTSKLVETNQEKSRFLANTSHELRTPLNAIIGYSEILKDEIDELDTQAIVNDLDKIRNSGQHLLELINDILDLSKIESGKLEFFYEKVEINNLVDEVIEMVRPMAEKNNNIIKAFYKAAARNINTDKTRLKQVLFNLLSNASKFTSEGNITIRVTNGKPGRIKVTVEDTGIGIEKEQLNNVFNPFIQADRSTTKTYGGTGLGLAICKRFIEMMGGTIDVQSKKNKGSTFTINLPVSPGPVLAS